jgi:chemotaxis methyl-accepting protein methylase
VVGVGASAGGLEALEQFLRPVPSDSRLAFVIVQHRSPDHDGALSALLQRASALPVVTASDGCVVEPGHVYVTPHGQDLTIRGGVLHTSPPMIVRGMRLPVDEFLRTLAVDRQHNAVGVILSGMGSDGTLGLRAIREGAGATLAQSPESAKSDGMPRSAIDAGVVDIIEEPAALFAAIMDFLQSRHELAVDDRTEVESPPASGLDAILQLLRRRSGHDFGQYKPTTLTRRISRRMGLHHLSRVEDYVAMLGANPDEIDRLFSEFLIGVTSFFRDRLMWEQLRTEVLPALLRSRPAGSTIRAWVAGCSTGEEAYSLAILLTEAIEALSPPHPLTIQVFATDLDARAIQRARKGTYPMNIAADVSEERLCRFFVQENHAYRVAKSIRDVVVFAKQNLLADPPFTKLDVLCCRNLLIYLNPPAQRMLQSLFHYSLSSDGVLVLGSAESIGGASDLFAPYPGATRLYRRLVTELPIDLINIPLTTPPTEALSRSAPLPTSPPPSAALPSLADRLLLSRYAPTAVLVGPEGDIQYVSGRTGRFLEPAAGRANWNVLAMARDGLRTVLTEGLRRAVRKHITVSLSEIKVTSEAGVHTVDVTIEPLSAAVGMEGMVLVLFSETGTPEKVLPAAKRPRTTSDDVRIIDLADELKHTLDELRAAREEMQLSQEELKSSNEELQSTNEELQSTNEELTTSKEEVQSMNEELLRVNQELLTKVDQLTLASSDMSNLLNSTNSATIFLDRSLNIRRFTAPMSSIIRLRGTDIGRPVTDISATLDFAEIAKDAEEVLRTLVTHERNVSSTDERQFTVRIMPYRTHDDHIDGVVVTFDDVSGVRRTEPPSPPSAPSSALPSASPVAGA